MTAYGVAGPAGIEDFGDRKNYREFGLNRPGPLGIEDMGIVFNPLDQEVVAPFVSAPKSSISFSFEISKGIFIIDSPEFKGVMSATSGRPESCMNKAELLCQMMENTGPIPVGVYFIYSDELSAPGLLGSTYRFLRRRADWGSFRVPLHPAPQTITYGRTGFFLHGGSWPGSAGCIDVGGGLAGDEAVQRLIELIRNSKERIVLEVRV